MTSRDDLVERRILQYEARMKRIDELLAKAKAAATKAEAHEELAQLHGEREKLADALEQIKEKSLEEWAREGGPMVIWDLIAERVERLVERLEK